MSVIPASKFLTAYRFHFFSSCIITKISDRRGLIFRFQQPPKGAVSAGGNEDICDVRSIDLGGSGGQAQ